MLKSAQNFLTWGEVTKETMNKLIRERGRIAGNKKLTDEYAQKIGYTSLNELVDSIYNCNLEYWKLPDIQPIFKLHPPSKGFKGKIKKAYGMGGELGYRKEKINELANRMI
jgi:large subunit ribosomal protein L30